MSIILFQGYKNDLKAAMDQVDNQYLQEILKARLTPEEKEEPKAEEQKEVTEEKKKQEEPKETETADKKEEDKPKKEKKDTE